ncbi:uncharacterized protein [Heliangelus exortis]|uniref:uncharacterized protein isoform X2 n=1 Tax=Heliangelus exortis TaxID=472823 RepID=UPI003A93C8D1
MPPTRSTMVGNASAGAKPAVTVPLRTCPTVSPEPPAAAEMSPDVPKAGGDPDVRGTPVRRGGGGGGRGGRVYFGVKKAKTGQEH